MNEKYKNGLVLGRKKNAEGINATFVSKLLRSKLSQEEKVLLLQKVQNRHITWTEAGKRLLVIDTLSNSVYSNGFKIYKMVLI